MATCAHYMRIYILYLELRARQCPESSQVIVRCSRQHPGEGYRNVMVRIHQRVPFAYFIVECPLPCEFIRISPYQSGRLARPMELYEQSVFCRTFQYLFLDAYHFLVITVHKVHHESFYPPFLIERKSFFEFVVQRSPVYPQMYTNSLVPRIFHNSWHVQTWYRSCDVCIGSCPPEIEVVIVIPRSLCISVDSMCIQAIACSKINVVLIGVKIIPGRECTVRYNIPVPPCERGPTRLNPGSIFDPTRLVQTREYICLEQSSHSVYNGYNAPRGTVGEAVYLNFYLLLSQFW